MLKWLKKIFNSEISLNQNELKSITLNEIDVFDTVWVEDNGIIQEGWIYDKTKRRLVIVVGSNEYIVHYNRPLTQTKIEFNNKILHLNKPC